MVMSQAGLGMAISHSGFPHDVVHEIDQCLVTVVVNSHVGNQIKTASWVWSLLWSLIHRCI